MISWKMQQNSLKSSSYTTTQIQVIWVAARPLQERVGTAETMTTINAISEKRQKKCQG